MKEKKKKKPGFNEAVSHAKNISAKQNKTALFFLAFAEKGKQSPMFLLIFTEAHDSASSIKCTPRNSQIQKIKKWRSGGKRRGIRE